MSNGAASIHISSIGLLALVLSGGLALRVSAATADPPSITTAAGVHELDPETARQYPTVQLEGVVTHFNARLRDGFFLQDDTDGIYIKLGTNQVSIKPGDHLRVSGIAAQGDYAPVVHLQHWQQLGVAPLPPALRVQASQLQSGRYDSRRVEIQGIVRSAEPALRSGDAHLAIQLRSDGQDLVVGINDYQPSSTNLVDAEIVARGVAAGLFSRQRQLLSPVLLLNTDEDLEVITPPQAVEIMPQLTIRSLFRYSPQGFPQRRVRIHGQLLGKQSHRWLAINDGTSGLFVESSVGDDLDPGDELDLVGFPEMRDQTLWLRSAIVTRVGKGPIPTAGDSTVGEALSRPTSLLRLTGTITSIPRPGDGVWVLTLENGESRFEAWLPADGGGHPSDWREGTILRVTGIAEPYILPTHQLTLFPFPQGLRHHARTLDDVEIVKAAPWWTSPKLTRIIVASFIGTLALLCLISLVAVTLARKNVALREARRRLRAAQLELSRRFTARTGEWREELVARHAAEADFALLTAERTRLARELHDTLEQSLASVALHLDAAKAYVREAPEKSEDLIENATRHLRDGQAEVRRSVWDLRSVKLEEATLPEALHQLAHALEDPSGPAVTARCEGQPITISPGVASHLFRVAQEGVTNALKYASAKSIEIVLAFKPTLIELTVTDDGCGFDVTAPLSDGHFGQRGLQERAAALQANLKLESEPGHGTRIVFGVPRDHGQDSYNNAPV